MSITLPSTTTIEIQQQNQEHISFADIQVFGIDLPVATMEELDANNQIEVTDLGKVTQNDCTTLCSTT